MKQHRWIVAVVYQISEEAAERVVGGEVLNLGHRDRIGVDGPGCLDCERTFEEARGTPCEAAPANEPR